MPRDGLQRRRLEAVLSRRLRTEASGVSKRRIERFEAAEAPIVRPTRPSIWRAAGMKGHLRLRAVLQIAESGLTP